MHIRIKEICEQKGISIAELGRRIGKERSSMYTILNNNNPTIETLSLIAKALEVEITELLMEKKEKDTKYIQCPRCGLKLFEVEEK